MTYILGLGGCPLYEKYYFSFIIKKGLRKTGLLLLLFRFIDYIEIPVLISSCRFFKFYCTKVRRHLLPGVSSPSVALWIWNVPYKLMFWSLVPSLSHYLKCLVAAGHCGGCLMDVPSLFLVPLLPGLSCEQHPAHTSTAVVWSASLMESLWNCFEKSK